MLQILPYIFYKNQSGTFNLTSICHWHVLDLFSQELQPPLQKAGYATTHMSVASIFPDSQMCYGPAPWAFDGKSSMTQKVVFFHQ